MAQSFRLLLLFFPFRVSRLRQQCLSFLSQIFLSHLLEWGEKSQRKLCPGHQRRSHLGLRRTSGLLMATPSISSYSLATLFLESTRLVSSWEGWFGNAPCLDGGSVRLPLVNDFAPSDRVFLTCCGKPVIPWYVRTAQASYRHMQTRGRHRQSVQTSGGSS